MPLPRPRFRELVCGGLGDGGYAPESIRIGEARIAGACQRLECGIEFDMDAVVVAVHVSPHPAGVFVEGDRGDLVDGAVAVAEDEAISVGQRVGGDPWCDDYGHRWFLSVSSGITLMVLKRAADATFDARCGQVMADTLVERVTGRPAEEAESVALNLVMSDQVLWGRDNAPAELDGYGPIPASLAQRVVRDAVVDERSLATLRRLYRYPKSVPAVLTAGTPTGDLTVTVA